MNGSGKAKKAFTAGFVVAFLLCGVFGGLVVEQGLGFVVGCETVTDCLWSSGLACYRYLNFSVVNPVGTFGEVNSLNVYVRNTSASQYVNMGLYKDGYIVYQGSAVKVNDSDGEWVEFVPDNLGIQDGNYCLAVYYNTGLEFAYQSLAGYSANKSAASSSVFPYLQVIDGNYTDGAVVMFMDYSVLSGEVSYVDTSATSGMWLGVGVSFGLVAISLLLALKSRSWAVNFLFGLSLVGFLGWEFANATTELFGGWLLFMVLVGAVLVLVKGAVLVRASGV